MRGDWLFPLWGVVRAPGVVVLSLRWVLDRFWWLVRPLLPEFTPRPQGGGTALVDEVVVRVRSEMAAKGSWHGHRHVWGSSNGLR